MADELRPALWFQAKWREHNVLIGVDASIVNLEADALTCVSKDLVAALVLRQVDELVCWIEYWFNAELEFVPCSAPLLENAGASVLGIFTDRQRPTLGIQLVIPAEMAAIIQAPPEILEQNVQIEWAMTAFNLRFEAIDISSAQLAKMAVGGMVIIPQTFSAQWPVVLQVDGWNQSIAAVFDKTTQRLQSKPSDSTIANQDQFSNTQLTIDIANSLAVPANKLFGWAESEAIGIDWYALQSSQVHLRIADSLIASGRLMPIFNGYGVMLDSIQSATPTSSL